MGFYGETQAQDHDFKQVLRNTRTTIDDTEMYYSIVNNEPLFTQSIRLKSIFFPQNFYPMSVTLYIKILVIRLN